MKALEEMSVKELKVLAFDIDQQIRQLQQQYNQVLTQIVAKNKPKKATKK